MNNELYIFVNRIFTTPAAKDFVEFCKEHSTKNPDGTDKDKSKSVYRWKKGDKSISDENQDLIKKWLKARGKTAELKEFNRILNAEYAAKVTLKRDQESYTLSDKMLEEEKVRAFNDLSRVFFTLDECFGLVENFPCSSMIHISVSRTAYHKDELAALRSVYPRLAPYDSLAQWDYYTQYMTKMEKYGLTEDFFTRCHMDIGDLPAKLSDIPQKAYDELYKNKSEYFAKQQVVSGFEYEKYKAFIYLLYETTYREVSKEKLVVTLKNLSPPILQREINKIKKESDQALIEKYFKPYLKDLYLRIIKKETGWDGRDIPYFISNAVEFISEYDTKTVSVSVDLRLTNEGNRLAEYYKRRSEDIL